MEDQRHARIGRRRQQRRRPRDLDPVGIIGQKGADLDLDQLAESGVLDDAELDSAKDRLSDVRRRLEEAREKELIEDAVEQVVRDLGLPYAMRGRFVGRNGDTGPADLAAPDFEHALVAVACKGFDSTGSKLTAAVSEVTEMANVSFAHQYVLAVVDGIGWLSRQGDFRRMHGLLDDHRIDGLYALADLERFRDDLRAAAVRHGLLEG